jgi:hypothetical protein
VRNEPNARQSKSLPLATVVLLTTASMPLQSLGEALGRGSPGSRKRFEAGGQHPPEGLRRGSLVSSGLRVRRRR